MNFIQNQEWSYINANNFGFDPNYDLWTSFLAIQLTHFGEKAIHPDKKILKEICPDYPKRLSLTKGNKEQLWFDFVKFEPAYLLKYAKIPRYYDAVTVTQCQRVIEDIEKYHKYTQSNCLEKTKNELIDIKTKIDKGFFTKKYYNELQ